MQRASASTRHQLLAVLGVVALIALIALLPDFAAPSGSGDGTVSAFRATIERIDEPAPGGNGPAVPMARVRLLDGPRSGEVLDAYLSGPGGSQVVARYAAGEEVVVTITQGPDPTQPFIAVSDRWRIPWLQLLGLLSAAAIVLIGGWHGVRALVGLGLTIAVVIKVILPLLIAGAAPVPLAVLAAAGVTVVTILVTEGPRRSSLAAILGTTAALAITGLLGAAATAVMGFTYSAGTELAFLAGPDGQGLDLRGVLLAAFMLGAVGVLDDVTVTQAVLVEELATRGGLRGSGVIASAMAVGRSHIAATVNTLFLAYLGAGLPLLLLLVVSGQPASLVFNSETIATEIVRTLVGSLGIVTAVPLTTLVAASLVRGAAEPAAASPGVRLRHLRLALTIAAVSVLVLATAALPLTTGPRPPLAPPVFDPDRSIPDGSPSPAPVPSGPSLGTPILVPPGRALPIVVDGRAVGTVSIENWVRTSTDPAMDGVMVLVRYEALAPFGLDAGRWVVLLLDGTEVPLAAQDESGPFPRTLGAGDIVLVTLEGGIPADEPEVVLAYVESASAERLYATTLE
jgi:uncharacterized membrane protein